MLSTCLYFSCQVGTIVDVLQEDDDDAMSSQPRQWRTGTIRRIHKDDTLKVYRPLGITQDVMYVCSYMSITICILIQLYMILMVC